MSSVQGRHSSNTLTCWALSGPSRHNDSQRIWRSVTGQPIKPQGMGALLIRRPVVRIEGTYDSLSLLDWFDIVLLWTAFDDTPRTPRHATQSIHFTDATHVALFLLWDTKKACRSLPRKKMRTGAVALYYVQALYYVDYRTFRCYG